MSGITLSQIANRLAVLNVACSKCERSGRYRVANLMASHGADTRLTDLALKLCADRRNSDTFTAQRCDVFFPDLSVIPPKRNLP